MAIGGMRSSYKTRVGSTAGDQARKQSVAKLIQAQQEAARKKAEQDKNLQQENIRRAMASGGLSFYDSRTGQYLRRGSAITPHGISDEYLYGNQGFTSPASGAPNAPMMATRDVKGLIPDDVADITGVTAAGNFISDPNFQTGTDLLINRPGLEQIFSYGSGTASKLGLLGPAPDLSKLTAIDIAPFAAPKESLAQATYKAGLDESTKRAMGQMGSIRGASAALQSRMAQQEAQDLRQALTQQSAIDKLKEDEANRQRMIEFEKMLQNQGQFAVYPQGSGEREKQFAQMVSGLGTGLLGASAFA